VDVEIREEPIAALGEVGGISIAFEVDRVLEVSTPNEGLGGIVLTEKSVAEPYMVDHDVRAGAGPARWAQRFDVSKWGLVFAHLEGKRIGAAVVAFDTRNVFMLEGRRDIAALWDLRVDKEFRGVGVGHRLVGAAETWAEARGCRRLKIETQNVNVTACRFYVRQGYILGSVIRFAYDDAPDETQLLYVKELEAHGPVE
jgi:GNAT superfamily N-acetyltransferase